MLYGKVNELLKKKGSERMSSRFYKEEAEKTKFWYGGLNEIQCGKYTAKVPFLN